MKNLSIVIPIFNEELVLKRQLKRLVEGLMRLTNLPKWELLLIDNGSLDKTYNIAKKLANKYQFIRLLKLPSPSYGQAFKKGILHARFPIIVQFDIDFWDLSFLKKAIRLLAKYDFIIGSKNLSKSVDQRSLSRKIISKIIELLIRIRFNVNLSDTHGLKVIKREAIIGLVNSIEAPNHFFDSELLIKCYKLGYRFKELAVNLREIRESRFSFLLRAKDVVVEFYKLLLVNTNLTSGKEFSLLYKIRKNLRLIFKDTVLLRDLYTS